MTVFERIRRTRSGHFLGGGLVGGLAVFVVLFSCPVLLSSCGRPVEGDSIKLDLAGNGNLNATQTSGNFSEEACVVLRCSSFIQNENGILAKVSKAKALKATTLVFVEPIQAMDQGSARIAAVSIAGSECEYDISQARFFEVTTQSAKTAIDGYGITYADWQTGVSSSSEKFPCCE